MVIELNEGASAFAWPVGEPKGVGANGGTGSPVCVCMGSSVVSASGDASREVLSVGDRRDLADGKPSEGWEEVGGFDECRC